MRVGALHFSHTYWSAEIGSGASFSRMPPVCAVPPMFCCCVPCLVCRLTMFRPSTVAFPAFGNTALTVPRLPFSLPRRIMTVSPLTMFAIRLENLRRQRRDLQKAAVAQLAHDRPEDARAARIQLVFV